MFTAALSISTCCRSLCCAVLAGSSSLPSSASCSLAAAGTVFLTGSTSEDVPRTKSKSRYVGGESFCRGPRACFNLSCSEPPFDLNPRNTTRRSVIYHKQIARQSAFVSLLSTAGRRRRGGQPCEEFHHQDDLVTDSHTCARHHFPP